MFRYSLTFLCGALLSAALMAANAPSQKVFPFRYDQHDFPNGLRLITIPTDTPNVVALYIVVQTGSRNEVEAGKSGFAHLFEHMMFRGTPDYPPEKYEEVIKSAGAASNAYTTDDHTAYHTVFSKEDLETMLKMEADRFQHLTYPESLLRTESLAVLGEYNKNSAAPGAKLSEVLRDTAFTTHTYKHTTMGFLKDVQAMPEQYRVLEAVLSALLPARIHHRHRRRRRHSEADRGLVAKYWGDWKRGTYKADVPVEPVQDAPRTAHVDWPSPTLPLLAIAFKVPAYQDTSREYAAIQLMESLGFGPTSDLYQRLVIQEQKVDALGASAPDTVDPYLFTITARIKKQGDMDSVQKEILATVDGFKQNLVPADKLDALKKHLRYQFAMAMDNPEAVAATTARFVALRRTPETINTMYQSFQEVTPEDIRAAARKYFIENNRTIVTLTGGKAK